ncbi:MAG: hypothetical protein ACI83B_001301 [Sediminicola sp.]
MVLGKINVVAKEAIITIPLKIIDF